MIDKSPVTNLSSHALFHGLDEQFLAFLAQCTRELQLGEGQPLFKQGEAADKFYLLRSGRISVQIPSLVGPPLEIQSLESGEVLGWSWLIAPYQWNFQAVAETDCDLLEFDGGAVLARCEQDPKFGSELLKRFAALMSERLDAARQRVMNEWSPPAGFA